MSLTDELDLAWYERLGKSVLDSIGSKFHAIPSMGCTEPDYPSTSVILDVPGLCQVSTYTCGCTATWSIISALGYKVSLKQWFGLCHEVGCHPDSGMDIAQIAKALKRLKLKVSNRRFTGKRQIIKHIDAGQPILFGQGTEITEEGDHWMYVYGYSPRHVFVGNHVNPLYPIRSKIEWGWKELDSEIVAREIYIINT